MTDANKIVIAGRVSRDPEYRQTANGTGMLSFSFASNRAVNRNGAWESEASFFDAKLWGAKADGLRGLLAKGRQVIVTGSLVQERWDDRETGAKKSRVVISAESVQLLGGKHENAGGGGYESF